VALGVSDALGWALGMSAVRGVGFGILTVTGSAVVADLVPVTRRGEAIGFYGLGIALPNLVLLPASVPLAENVGYWLVFGIGALPVLGIPAALALGRTLDGAGGGDGPPPARQVTPWSRTGGVVAAAVVLLAATLSGGALMTFLPQLTGSSSVAFVALLVLGLVAAAGRWRIGKVADRLGADRLLLPLLLTVVAGLLLAALALAQDGGHARTWLLLVAVVVVGIGYGTLQNLTLVVALSRVVPGDHGRASAIWNVGFDGGTALGAVLFGFVATNASFSIAFLVLSGLAAASLPLTLGRRT
jgi:predicted MFS family arabinose efflux permease